MAAWRWSSTGDATIARPRPQPCCDPSGGGPPQSRPARPWTHGGGPSAARRAVPRPSSPERDMSTTLERPAPATPSTAAAPRGGPTPPIPGLLARRETFVVLATLAVLIAAAV